MTTSNDFSKYYKTITNTELLSILDNPGNYQPLAVEAAKNEFADRKLSETAIEEAREPLLIKQEQKEKQRQKIKAVEHIIKSTGHTLLDTLNPIQPGIPSTEKIIRLIVIVFAGLFLFQFISNFQMHLAYIQDIPRFPLGSIVYLLPQIVLPIAIVTFWKRKALGWILLTIFLVFSAVGAIGLLNQAFNWKPSGLAGLDRFFPRPSPTTYIVQLLFLGGTIYVLCRAGIREVFHIDKQKMGITIGITALVTFALMFVIS